MSPPSTASKRPTGMRVKNATAATPARTGETRRGSAAGITHSCRRKRRHIFEQRDRTTNQGQRQCCATALPEPQAEIKKRFESEVDQDAAMAGLGREMRSDHGVATQRRKSCRDQGRCGSDEAIEDDDDAVGSSTEDHTYEEGD